MTVAVAPDRAAARRRAVSGFTLYDVANSAFTTTVVTAVGGPFLTAVAKAAEDVDGRVALLGLHPRGAAVYAYAVSVSVLFQVLLLPVLGAVADRAAAKRGLLIGGTVVGSVATLALAAVPMGAPLLGLSAFIVANVAYGVAIMTYNAYLADVAAPEDRDRVSARGFAAGYAGGAFVLALGLALITAAEPLGVGRGVAVRLAIVLAAVWWMAVGAVAISRLGAVRQLEVPDRPTDVPAPDVPAPDVPAPAGPAPAVPAPAAPAVPSPAAPSLRRQVAEGLGQLRGSVSALRKLPGTLRFLVAFLLFNDAIQAVVALSAVVLTQELFVAKGRPADDATSFLLTLILLIQVVAVVGAAGSARLARRIGARTTLLLTLVIWVAVVLYAVLSLDGTTAAYAMGIVIALVLGGSQALARSLFSSMVPDGRQASFFGFYELAERGTAWIGTLLFAVVLDVTGSYRGALLSLLVLFLTGGALLATTDTDEAIRVAQAEPAAVDAR